MRGVILGLQKVLVILPNEYSLTFKCEK